MRAARPGRIDSRFGLDIFHCGFGGFGVVDGRGSVIDTTLRVLARDTPEHRAPSEEPPADVQRASWASGVELLLLKSLFCSNLRQLIGRRSRHAQEWHEFGVFVWAMGQARIRVALARGVALILSQCERLHLMHARL